jgi:hypothetical protein
MKFHIVKTTFKNGQVEYFLDESPPSCPFEKVEKEESFPVKVFMKKKILTWDDFSYESPVSGKRIFDLTKTCETLKKLGIRNVEIWKDKG